MLVSVFPFIVEVDAFICIYIYIQIYTLTDNVLGTYLDLTWEDLLSPAVSRKNWILLYLVRARSVCSSRSRNEGISRSQLTVATHGRSSMVSEERDSSPPPFSFNVTTHD